MKLKYFAIILLCILLFFLAYISLAKTSNLVENRNFEKTWWEVQSIDTVKYSRDVAREKAKDLTFDQTIDKQVSLIAATGATHIAIGTPYDKEFLPFMKRWIAAARKNGLKVWFRGNLAGWEGWFGYPKITREQHIEGIRELILSNGDIFEDGDIFSACPECENGGPGDPRHTGDVVGHRAFLVEEYKSTNDAFRRVGKNVRANFTPMNGDVARLVMDKETTKALGGIVVMDHYVATPQMLISDINKLAESSGGKVVLGEFGAPIPDIHGNMSQAQQAEWIEEALGQLLSLDSVRGLNYWVSFGGTTSLWESSGNPKRVVEVIKKYFSPNSLSIRVVDEIEKPIEFVRVQIGTRKTFSDENGYITLLFLDENETVKLTKSGFVEYTGNIRELMGKENVTLKMSEETLIFKLLKYFYRMKSKI